MHWSTEQHMIWTCWLLASGAEYSKLLVMYSIGNLERSKIDSNYFYCKGDIFKDICVFKKMTKKIIQWVLGQSSSIFLIILTSQLRDSVKNFFYIFFSLSFFCLDASFCFSFYAGCGLLIYLLWNICIIKNINGKHGLAACYNNIVFHYLCYLFCCGLWNMNNMPDAKATNL